MRHLILAFVVGSALFARADIQIIDGVKYECKDGMCMIVEDDAETEEKASNAADSFSSDLRPFRTAQGYMSSDEFVRWLKNDGAADAISMTTSVGSLSFWIGILMILLGGLAMNLTPCVLPMIPINLMIIGKSAARGAWYALGIALAYGTLGLLAAVGGLAFGTIQGNPWFNVFIAILFVCLALALLDVFFIDLSRFRKSFSLQPSTSNLFFPFFMGVVSAVLAGACVAPILISVLLLTAKLYAEGVVFALGLPFVMGLGMALPWPFLGAGLKVLPKPGAWMKWVNRLFALMVLGFAVWYGKLAWEGFNRDVREEVGVPAEGRLSATPETLNAKLSTLRSESAKPILIDCWATWCKNCSAMERVLEEPKVREVLKDFTVIRLQAEDMKALNGLKGFESIRGLPAFVIVDSASEPMPKDQKK